MASTFHHAINRFAALIAADRVPGSTSLTLETGAGAALGDVSPEAPVYLVAFRASAVDAFGRVIDPSGVTLIDVTGVTGDVLAASVVPGNPDLALFAGDKVYGLMTAEHLAELQAAVAALESGGGSGSVTSVGLTLPSGEFDVSGSPVTSSGTLAAAWKDVAPNKVLAGPAGGAAMAPAFRYIVAADVPDLSGVYAVANHNHDSRYYTQTQVNTFLAGKADDAAVVHLAGAETIAGNKTFTGNVSVGQTGTYPFQVWIFNGTVLRPFLEIEYESNRGAMRFMAAGPGDTQTFTFLPRYSTGSAIQTSTSTLILRISGMEYQFGTGGSLNINGFPLILTTQFGNTTPLVVQGRSGQTAALVRLQGITSTSTARDQAHIDTEWADSTDATRKGRLKLSAADTAAREGIRIEAGGGSALIGFYGAAAVAKPTVTGSRGGNAALASLLTQLASLGLIVDSTSA